MCWITTIDIIGGTVEDEWTMNGVKKEEGDKMRRHENQVDDVEVDEGKE